MPSAARYCGLLWLAFQLPACRSDCDPRVCPTIDQAASPADIRVELAAGQVLGLESGDIKGLGLTVGGELVATSNDIYCIGSLSIPCSLTLKRLRLDLGPIELQTTDDETVRLQDAKLSVAGPLTLQDSGMGYQLPAGTRVVASLVVDGQSDCGEATTDAPAYLRLGANQQILTFDGTLPLKLHLTEQACQSVQLEVSGMVSGVSPWAQLPKS